MENKKCSVKVWSDWHNYPCSKKVTVERDGKHYCTIHDPVRIKNKDKERSDKWHKEMEENKKRRDFERLRSEQYPVMKSILEDLVNNGWNAGITERAKQILKFE